MSVTHMNGDSSPKRRISIFSIKNQKKSALPDAGQQGMANDFNSFSTTPYAQKRKQLINLIKNLMGQGANQFFDIPRIAVIGGQSAGKSSVVEAITGISVPRDYGTCTRCPMECTVSSSVESWSCKIGLRYEYKPNELIGAKTVPFSPRLTNKGDVEIWLRRAQAALLSPHRPPEHFHDQTLPQLRVLQKDSQTLKFSRDVVYVDIEDPDATDLGFIDLPGLVQNEDPEMVGLVQDLAVSTIKVESTIILVTIPVTDEMENQLASRLAREVDPEGQRTIGVLTKPDNLRSGDLGALARWVDVIQGKSNKLTHGYYCVRLPDDAERSRNITRAEAERIEREFFETRDPWKELANRRRLGIPQFVSELSSLFMSLIEKQLPALNKAVRQRLANCDAQLSQLPTPPQTDNPNAEVLQRVTDFCTVLKAMVHGHQGGSKELIQRNRASYGILKKDIEETAPDFWPSDTPRLYEDACTNEIDAGDDGDDGNSDTNPPAQSLNLYDVRRVIQKHIGWEHPGIVPFEAHKELIRAFVQLWSVPTEDCFGRAYQILFDIVDDLIVEHFRSFPQLESFVRAIVIERHREAQVAAHKAVMKTLSGESEPFWTQNEHDEATRQKWLTHYKQVRNHAHLYQRSSAVPVYGDPSSAQRRALTALAEAGFPNLSAYDLQRLYPPDAFEQELNVMASVRAFFEVAYKRFTDVVPLRIEHDLNQAFSNELLRAILIILDRSNKKELLSEDTELVKSRTLLEGERKRLLAIQHELTHFTL